MAIHDRPDFRDRNDWTTYAIGGLLALLVLIGLIWVAADESGQQGVQTQSAPEVQGPAATSKEPLAIPEAPATPATPPASPPPPTTNP